MLTIRIHGTVCSFRRVKLASVILRVRSPLYLTVARQLTVVVRFIVLVVPIALVLNPRGRGVQAIPLWAIHLTTLLLDKKGGTLLNNLLPLHSMLTFTGFTSPRLEKVIKLMFSVRILTGTRGVSRVVLTIIMVLRPRVRLTTVLTGPAWLNIPDIRVIVIRVAPLATPVLSLVTGRSLLGWYLRQCRAVLARWVITC